MTDRLTTQLATWLAATDIDCLELRGPGVHLCLINRNGQVDLALASVSPHAAAGKLTVTAQSVGRYQHSHPAHEQPLVAVGQAITAGQAVGLLQVGSLLMPVVSPEAGYMVRHLVAAGATVGYGTALAEIRSTTAALKAKGHGH
jgi:acetyl-CoA carboxylase biotin carboxyl carrier protein